MSELKERINQLIEHFTNKHVEPNVIKLPKDIFDELRDNGEIIEKKGFYMDGLKVFYHHKLEEIIVQRTEESEYYDKEEVVR